MKKQNAILIFLFCTALFFISFVYGYKMMGPKVNKQNIIIGEDRTEDNMDLEILKEEEKISPNVYIEKKTYYKACNHNITKLNELDEKIVNMTEKQYRDYMEENFPNVKIISFSINRIVLREEKDHLCPNHYIIGESEGKIAIYRIDENGDRVLDRVFNDYSISLLKQIDQEKLKQGIRVDSEEELSNVLENFIS
ncbi:BofC C-terminal domain-containing protein [Clostridium sp. Cult1]|uniref:BofC C-terminal domain-containing protein n=1 Tax=Clostridium sp. Cult1 TaxID=2079002 RepID=UPI001F38960C|nr:BofC C-terminal domain-containing protein [Clostridium sp. Cult1]MCF6462753.1 hypothetical protein [Clostridium sp. Cult1]